MTLIYFKNKKKGVYKQETISEYFFYFTFYSEAFQQKH